MNRPPPSQARRPAGAGAAEFLLAAIPLLLAGMGIVEFAQWFFVRQAVSLALLQAARAGSTQHASPQAIASAFEEALLPLHPAPSRQQSRLRLQRQMAGAGAALGGQPWLLEVRSPLPAAFQDFAAAGLRIPGAAGLSAIDNDYQAEQYERHRARGWPQGRGPVSGLTIFQANTLVLHLVYPYKPMAPGLGGLLRLLPASGQGYAGRVLAAGYLPMRQEIQLTMQSHPVLWPMETREPQAPPSAAACQGMWCPSAAAAPVWAGTPGGGPDQGADTPVSSWLPEPPAQPAAPSAPDPGPVHEDAQPGLPGADDLACGISLCCPAG